MVSATTPFFPEVCQDVQQENHAQSIQYKKNSHGLVPPYVRRQLRISGNPAFFRLLPDEP
jgi:hypothetical protein